MYNTTRAATIKASSDCKLWIMDRYNFRAIKVSQAHFVVCGNHPHPVLEIRRATHAAPLHNRRASRVFTCKCVCSADRVLMSTGDEPEVLQRGGHGLPGQCQDRHQDAGGGKHSLQHATAVELASACKPGYMLNGEWILHWLMRIHGADDYVRMSCCTDLRPLGPAAHCQSHGEAPVREWAAHHHARGAWRPLFHRTRGEFTPASP